MANSPRIPATFDVADLTHPDLEKDAELRALAKGEDMTPLEILKQARELISVPERWTQRASARSKNGDIVESNDVSAICWCSFGAIMRVCSYNHPERWIAEEHLDDVAPNYIKFNDTHTHAEVLAAFDRAIAAAEGGR